MNCKTCRQEYTYSDGLQLGQNRYGWHPSFGDCFMCFCYASFGGMLEPWGGEKWREFQGYKITPVGVPSKFEFQSKLDEFWAECEREGDLLTADWPDCFPEDNGPIEDVPF